MHQLPLLLVDSLMQELDREGESTARLLARVPVDQLDFRPHPKSTALGDLAWHIASIPRRISALIRAGAFDLSLAAPPVRGSDDFVGELKASLADARSLLRGMDEQALARPFTLTHRGQTIVSMPVAGAIRTIMFNHSYHHRGQLTVYLRLLDVPLPILYGSTADEKP